MPANSKATVQELELELRNIRTAFEEYIASSRELENGLDMEVTELHGRLAETQQINVTMSKKLQSIEPILANLEHAVEDQKAKLAEEQTKRMAAETALRNNSNDNHSMMEDSRDAKESDERIRKLEKDNRALRDECDAIHEELAFKCKELDMTVEEHEKYLQQLDEERSRIGGVQKAASIPGSVKTDMACESTDKEEQLQGTLQMDESYTEVLSELESVTEQFVKTQQKLWEAEDKLREAETKTDRLEIQVQKLQSARENDLSQYQQEEKSFTEEREILRRELAMANEELRTAEDDAQLYRERLEDMKGQSQGRGEQWEDKISQLQGDVRKKNNEIEDLENMLRLVGESTEEQWQGKVERLHNEMLQKDKNIHKLELALEKTTENAKDQWHGKVSKLQGDIRTKNVEIRELKLAKEKVTDETQALWQGRVSELQNDIKAKDQEIQDLATTLQKVGDTTQGQWQGELVKLQGEARSKNIEIEHLNTMLKRDGRATTENARTIAELRAQNLSQKHAIEDLERMVQEMRQSASGASEDLYECRRALDESRQHCDNLQQEVGHLKQTLAEVDPSQYEEDIRSKIEDSIREHVSKEVRDVVTKEMKQERDREIALLREKFKKLFKDNESLQEKLQNSERLKDQVPRLKDEIYRLESTLSLKQKENAITIVEIETMWKNQAEVMKKEVARETKQKVLSKVEKDKEEVMNDLTILLEENDTMKLKMNELQTSYDDIMSDYTLAKQDIEDLSTQKGILCDKLKQSDDALVELQEEFDNAKETIEALHTELDELASERENDEGLQLISKLLQSNSSVSSVAPRGSVADPPSGESIRQARTIMVDQHDMASQSDTILRSRLEELLEENTVLRNHFMLDAEAGDNEKSASKTVHVLESCLDAYKQENDQLKDDIAALNERFESRMTDGVSDEKNSNDSQIAMLTLEKTDLNSRLVKSNESLELLEMLLSTTKDENVALKSEVSDLRESLTESRQSYSTVFNELAELRQAHDDMYPHQPKQYSSPKATDPSSNFFAEDLDSGFATLQRQMQDLTEEKEELQNHIDDARIALSVSEYAHEKCQDDLQATEAMLAEARDETRELQGKIEYMERGMSSSSPRATAMVTPTKNSARSSSGGFRDADGNDEHGHRIVSNEELHEVTEQLKRTQNLFRETQEKLHEVQRRLRSSENDGREKSDQIISLEERLRLCKEEIGVLSDERSRLSSDLELNRCEYDTVIQELETFQDVFEDAQQQAARSGREAAEKDLRAEVKNQRDKERSKLKAQLKKSVEENEGLRKQIETALSAERARANPEVNKKQTRMLKQEITLLKESLEASTQECKSLREKVFALNSELGKNKIELGRRTEDLKDAKRKIQQEQVDSSGGPQADDALYMSANSAKLSMLRDHLQRLVREEGRDDLSTNFSNDDDSIERAEALKLKVELVDMSMSLEKSTFENELLHEEIELLKTNLVEAKNEIEKQSAVASSTRAQLTKERQREMNGFKSQFNALLEENGTLKKKYKEIKSQAGKANEALEESQSHCGNLEGSLNEAKVSIEKYEEDLYNLNLELESTVEENERVVQTVSDELTAAHNESMRAVRRELSTLTKEKERLEKESASNEIALKRAHDLDGANSEKIKSLQQSLSSSKQRIVELESEVASLTDEIEKGNLAKLDTDEEHSAKQRSMIRKLEDKEQEVDKLKADIVLQNESLEASNQAVNRAKDECISTQKKLREVTTDLEQSRAELDALQQRYDGASSESEKRKKEIATQKGEIKQLRDKLKKSVSEASAIQQQLDNNKVALSVSEYSHERNHEELKACQELLKSSRDESILLKTELTKMNMSTTNSKKEQTKTQADLDEIEQMLKHLNAITETDDIDGLLAESDFGAAGFSESIVNDSATAGMTTNAWKVRRKMVELVKLLGKTKESNEKLSKELKVAKETMSKLARGPRNNAAPVNTDVQRLKNEIDNLTNQNAMLKKKIRELENAASSNQRESVQKSMEVKVLKAKVEDSSKEVVGLREKLKTQKSTGDAKMRENMAKQIASARVEAKKEGKAEAAVEFRVNLKSMKGEERKELVAQFKSLHQENSGLRKKLSETKAKSTKDVQKINREREKLQSELSTARKELKEANSSRDRVSEELQTMKRKFQDKIKVTKEGTGKVEIGVLQNEFKKLSQVSHKLSRKVVDAEEAIKAMQSEQEKNVDQYTKRTQIAKRLITEVEEAKGERQKREHDIDELAAALRTRVSLAEENVEKLGLEINLAKGALKVSEAGLVLRPNAAITADRTPYPSTTQKVNDPISNGDEDDDDEYRKMTSDIVTSESRDDTRMMMKREESRSFSPSVPIEVGRKDYRLPKRTPFTKHPSLLATRRDRIHKMDWGRRVYRPTPRTTSLVVDISEVHSVASKSDLSSSHAPSKKSELSSGRE